MKKWNRGRKEERKILERKYERNNWTKRKAKWKRKTKEKELNRDKKKKQIK